MALSVSGTTQYLTNSSPAAITAGFPVTVGCWVRPAAASGFHSVWELRAVPNDSNNRFAIYVWSGTSWAADVTVAGSDIIAEVTSAVTANAWQYLVARFISSTNRWMSVLQPTGAASHVQDTTSATPAAALAEAVIGGDPGFGEHFNGLIAEMWWTNSDIQSDGAQLRDQTLRQLAYGGPFSIPHIAKDIVEYRSFRKHPFLDEIGEVYYGAGAGAQTWTPTGTPTIGAHPPLPYWYVKPGQTESLLTI